MAEGKEPFDVLAENPAFQEYSKQVDDLFNTTLSKEIEASKAAHPDLNLALSQVPSGQPINLKTQALFGGNFATGPAPAAKVPDISSREYAEQLSNMIADPNTWKPQPSEYAKPYSYDAGIQNLNFDRYYNHPNFAKLGWSPYRDNELVYNQYSSWWDDFNRMRGQFIGLAGQGFKSMYGWASGDSQKFDRELANEFTRRMGIMNSSKEGFGASLTNFAGNAAYTVGIMSSFILEEAAIWGATALSGGALGEVTVPAAMASWGRALKRLQAGAKSAEAVEAGMAASKVAEGIKDIGTARKLFDYAKKLAPFENTRSFLGQGAKMLDGATDFNKLKDFAFIAKGTGSLYRDLREINAVVAESRLEGGMVRNEMTTDLINQFYLEHGRTPNKQEAEDIYAAANEGGVQTTLANIPTIYLSNKLVFGKMIKGWRPGSAVLTDMLKGVEKGTLVFNKEGKAEILKGLSRFGRGEYWKQAPSRILKNSLRYGKANMAEGIQEWTQEVISAQSKDYYTNIYSNPNLAGNRQFWGSLRRGVDEQISGQGLEVFLSGFFMGGLVQGPQNLIFKTLNESWTEYKSPEQFKEQKKAREKFENNIVNAYNATKGKGIIPFFNVLEQNMVEQTNLEAQMTQAEINKDRKEVEDIKDESLFSHLNALYRNGGVEHFIEQLEAMKEMTPEELAEAFPEGIATGDKYNAPLVERIDAVIGRAKDIESRMKQIDETFPNPYNPGQYSRTDQIAEFMQESINHHAFEEAKKHAVFANYAFDRALDRMHSLINKVGSKDKPLAKVDATDITSVFDMGQLNERIKSLTEEINVYSKGTAEQKTLAEKLKAKRDSFKSMAVAIANYARIAEDLKSGKLASKLVEAAAEREVPSYSNEYSIAAEAIDNLEKAYYDHIRLLGKQVNELVIDEKIGPSFVSLIDYLELDSDSKAYAKSVNTLFDPKGFKQMNDSTRDALKGVYDKRETLMREAYQKWLDLKDKSDLLVALGKAGVWIKAETVDEFNRGEFDKVKFFSAAKPFNEILKDSDKFKTSIQPLLDGYNKVSGKAPIEPEIKTEPVTTQGTMTQTSPITGEVTSTVTTQSTPAETVTPVATTAPTGIITADMTFEQMEAINPEAAETIKKYISSSVNLHRLEEEWIDLTDPKSYGPIVKNSAAIAQLIDHFNKLSTGVTPTKAEPTQKTEPVSEEKPAVTITPTTTIGNPGEIVYASPTVGKTTLVEQFPDQYVDGDQLLADYLKDPDNRDAFPFMESIDTLLEFVKSKKLNITKEELESNFVQKAGLIFAMVPDKEIYVQDLKEYFQRATEGGKIVLTSNIFALNFADQAYLMEDSKKGVDSMVAEFKKRDPKLGTSRAESDAKDRISKERAATKGMKITEVPSDKRLTDFLTQAPEVVSTELKDLINKAETIEELDAIFADAISKMEDDTYLKQQGLEADDITKLIDARKEELGLNVVFEDIKVGDILIMKDRKKYKNKGMAKVIKKTNKQIVIVPEDNKNVKITLNASSKNKIAYIYKKGQAISEPTPLSPEIQKASEETAKNVENTDITDVAAALKEIEGKSIEDIDKNKPKPPC